MKTLEEGPSHNVYNGEIGSQDNMKSFILTEARNCVDQYVNIDLPEIPKYGLQSNLLKCRFCGNIFRQAKKLRKHEAMNHDVSDPLYRDTRTANDQSTEVRAEDFVLNNTKSALLLCLLHLNHSNAIQMGDGNRIMNSNKHLYLLYKCHNCPKYAYGLLETLVQSNVLLSERKAYELMWNRTVNPRGAVDSNHPNDLDIDHQNKIFKDQADSYRGVFTEKATSRVSRAADTTDKILTNYDKVMKVFRPSGKHTPTNINDDILCLIGRISERRVYSFVPGWSYVGLQDISANPFKKLDGDSHREWISASLKKFAQEHFY